MYINRICQYTISDIVVKIETTFLSPNIISLSPRCFFWIENNCIDSKDQSQIISDAS